jgi:hypothetical protein
MSKLLDALDTVLDAFQAAGVTVDDSDPLGSGPQESFTVPLGATRAPTVAPPKASENRDYSTRATGATSNFRIQKPRARASDKTDVSLHRKAEVARSYPFKVAPMAPVEKGQKSGCFIGATIGATDDKSGIMSDFCGSRLFVGACDTSPGAIPGTLGPLQRYFGATKSVDDLPADLRAIFEERAAIAEFDGRSSRDAAEDVARDEAAAGPVGDDVTAWRSWMRSRLGMWLARGLLPSNALRTVWSEAENAWHLQHHPVANPDRCAGCREWMLDGPGMRLVDGAVVHFGNPDRFDCLLIYGEIWRGAASAALVALGLKSPHLVHPEGAAP